MAAIESAGIELSRDVSARLNSILSWILDETSLAIHPACHIVFGGTIGNTGSLEFDSLLSSIQIKHRKVVLQSIPFAPADDTEVD